jgi:transposase
VETVDHLALAKEDLAIAESGDSRREAYMRAAHHVAAHREATGDSAKQIALQLQVGRNTVENLLRWKKEGFKTDTPYSGREVSEKKDREKVRRFLREKPSEVIAALSAEAKKDPSVAEKVAKELARDKSLRRVTRSAIIEKDAETEAHAEKKAKQHKPKLTAMKDHSDASYLLVKARRMLREALESAQRIDWANAPGGESEARLDLLESLDDIDLLTGYLRSAIESGQHFDQEIEELLSKEAD